MKLEEFLQKEGISYPEFAAKIGVSLQSIYRYTAGTRLPERQVMARIMEETRGEVTADSFY